MNSFYLGSCSTAATSSSHVTFATSTSRFPPYRSLLNADSSSLSFSGNSSHNKITTTSVPEELNRNSTTCTRREAIGLGLGFSLFIESFLPPAPCLAAETIPCEFTEAPTGLAFCDKVLGSGPQAVKGQLIKAHYTGKLLDGTVFDSSYNRGKPLTFRVGVGEVIKGWDQGILGGDGVPPMSAGGKRTLKIPPELAYGIRGAGCRGGTCIIPPNSVLLFDVEFVDKA